METPPSPPTSQWPTQSQVAAPLQGAAVDADEDEDEVVGVDVDVDEDEGALEQQHQPIEFDP